MKVLITGREGQVARCLNDRLGDDPAYDLTFVARNGTSLHLDLARPETIRAAVQAVKPDVIVSAAAFTAVDLAEDEPDLAMTINGEAPGILAEEAKKCAARLIHISTDYVYDGALDRAYVETDSVNPIGVYGRSKLAGEQAIQRQMSDFVILRIPKPSGTDLSSTADMFVRSKHQLNAFLMVIVGKARFPDGLLFHFTRPIHGQVSKLRLKVSRRCRAELSNSMAA